MNITRKNSMDIGEIQFADMGKIKEAIEKFQSTLREQLKGEILIEWQCSIPVVYKIEGQDRLIKGQSFCMMPPMSAPDQMTHPYVHD